MEKFQTFVQLTRLNKPTGFMLLFWPCAWGLTLAFYFNNETDLYLNGGIKEIFLQLEKTAVLLINKYLDDYPKIKYKKWPIEKIVRKARKPIDSKLSFKQISKFSIEELYNFIRCLEDPYPNAYLENKNGKLYFKKVKFIKK